MSINRKITFSKDQLDTIKSMYLEGISLKAIGKEFEVSRSFMTSIVKEIGVYRVSRTTMKHEDYKKKVEELGRVKLIGKYKNSKTKILYVCLKHGEEHLAYPGNIMKGLGLICCKREGALLSNRGRAKQAAKDYDHKLRIASDGMFERRGEYITNATPILHYCVAHGEEHLAQPSNMLNGDGLKCCTYAWSRKHASIRTNHAKVNYDQNLQDRSEGKFIRIDDYINATTPILHHCLIHDEEHLAVPNQLLNGRGMTCCNTGNGWDTLENLLEKNSLNAQSEVEDTCQFYIFRVPDTDDLFKIGIARSARARASGPTKQGLYGEEICHWQCSSRRNAVLLETCILRDPVLKEPTDLSDSMVSCAGWTEVRAVMDIDGLLDHVQYLHESLEESKEWFKWALDNIPQLRKWEQKLLNEMIDINYGHERITD